MQPIVRAFFEDSGATAVEYALMIGFIAVAVVIAIGNLGSRLIGLFASDELTSAFD
jgi:Flp pilus assembly pilin Flp